MSSSVPWASNNWRDSSRRLPLLGHCIDSALKRTPVFLRKRSICLSRSFDLRDRLQVWHTPRGPQKGSPGTETGECNLGNLPPPHSSLLVSYRKELTLFLVAVIFAAAARLCWTARLVLPGPTEL